MVRGWLALGSRDDARDHHQQLLDDPRLDHALRWYDDLRRQRYAHVPRELHAFDRRSDCWRSDACAGDGDDHLDSLGATATPSRSTTPSRRPAPTSTPSPNSSCPQDGATFFRCDDDDRRRDGCQRRASGCRHCRRNHDHSDIQYVLHPAEHLRASRHNLVDEYSAGTVTVDASHFAVEKTVTGDEAAADTTFWFELKAASTTAVGLDATTMPLPKGATGAATWLSLVAPAGTASGTVVSDAVDTFGSISYTTPGTYTYEVKEVADDGSDVAPTDGGDGPMTRAAITVVVTVTDNGAGLLSSATTVDGSETNGIVFQRVRLHAGHARRGACRRPGAGRLRHLRSQRDLPSDNRRCRRHARPREAGRQCHPLGHGRRDGNGELRRRLRRDGLLAGNLRLSHHPV